MNRRSFLKIFAAAGPVAAVAPTYFFAPVGGWKSDVIVNPLQERLDASCRIMDDYMARVEYGMFLHDVGIPYWHVPGISDTYLGISRTVRA